MSTSPTYMAHQQYSGVPGGVERVNEAKRTATASPSQVTLIKQKLPNSVLGLVLEEGLDPVLAYEVERSSGAVLDDVGHVAAPKGFVPCSWYKRVKQFPTFVYQGISPDLMRGLGCWIWIMISTRSTAVQMLARINVKQKQNFCHRTPPLPTAVRAR